MMMGMAITVPHRKDSMLMLYSWRRKGRMKIKTLQLVLVDRSTFGSFYVFLIFLSSFVQIFCTF